MTTETHSIKLFNIGIYLMLFIPIVAIIGALYILLVPNTLITMWDIVIIQIIIFEIGTILIIQVLSKEMNQQ